MGEPPTDTILRFDELREELEWGHVIWSQSLDLIGKRVGGAHHIDPGAGQVEVGVAKRKCDLRTVDPATGVDDTPGQVSRRVNCPTGFAAENLDGLSLTKPETAPHVEGMPLGVIGNWDITAMGSDLAVPEKIETHYARPVILSYREAALRFWM
jgi:hypothetical protein